MTTTNKQQVYTQFFDVDAWLKPLADAGATPSSHLLPLTLSETKVLLAACEAVSTRELETAGDGSPPMEQTAQGVFAFVCQELAARETHVLRRLVARINTKLLALRGAGVQRPIQAKPTYKVFAKLSTRSPKDSSLLGPRLERIRIEDPHLAQCEGAPMAVTSGDEAIALLVTSERVKQDLVQAQRLAASRGQHKGAQSTAGGGDGVGVDEEENGQPSDISIVVRDWWHLPRWTELRGFVRRTNVDSPHRTLTALSQYYVDDEVRLCPEHKEWSTIGGMKPAL